MWGLWSENGAMVLVAAALGRRERGTKRRGNSLWNWHQPAAAKYDTARQLFSI